MSPERDSSIYVRPHRKLLPIHLCITTQPTALHLPNTTPYVPTFTLRSRIIWPLHLPYGSEPSRDAVQLHHTSRVHCCGGRHQDDSNDKGRRLPICIRAGMALALNYVLLMYMRGNILILSQRPDQGPRTQSPRGTKTNANSTALSQSLQLVTKHIYRKNNGTNADTRHFKTQTAMSKICPVVDLIIA